MRSLIILLIIGILTSCYPSKPSDELEAISEKVISKKEGIDIKITPIDRS